MQATNLIQQISQAGEHPFEFSGEAGQLEGVLTSTGKDQFPYMAIIGHPHSLKGGSMSNKVVTTLARTFRDLNIPSLRFNFRGVGKSEGVYDDGIGESEDMLILADLCHQAFPETPLIFSGFSFGSYVAYRAAAQRSHALLISVAPPVHHYDHHAFESVPSPWWILQGDEDEVVPADLVHVFVSEVNPPPLLMPFPETGHFFHRKLVLLNHQLTNLLIKRLGV